MKRNAAYLYDDSESLECGKANLYDESESFKREKFKELVSLLGTLYNSFAGDYIEKYAINIIKEHLNLEVFDYRDEEGNTLLMVAAKHRYPRVTAFLLGITQGNLHATNNKGYNLLTIAAKYGYINLIKYMLDRGSDINHTTSGGYTAFMLATYNNEVDSVACLLKHDDLNLNARDSKHNLSALDFAVIEGNIAVVRKILQHKNKIDSLDSAFKLCLDSHENGQDRSEIYNVLVKAMNAKFSFHVFITSSSGKIASEILGAKCPENISNLIAILTEFNKYGCFAKDRYDSHTTLQAHLETFTHFGGLTDITVNPLEAQRLITRYTELVKARTTAAVVAAAAAAAAAM